MLGLRMRGLCSPIPEPLLTSPITKGKKVKLFLFLLNKETHKFKVQLLEK